MRGRCGGAAWWEKREIGCRAWCAARRLGGVPGASGGSWPSDEGCLSSPGPVTNGIRRRRHRAKLAEVSCRESRRRDARRSGYTRLRPLPPSLAVLHGSVHFSWCMTARRAVHRQTPRRHRLRRRYPALPGCHSVTATGYCLSRTAQLMARSLEYLSFNFCGDARRYRHSRQWNVRFH